MKKQFIEKAMQKGSLMVEALAMLGLIAMVTPMVYKKAAERTTEMQDINEAGHLRIASRALDDYLINNFDNTTADADVTAEIGPYLPQGFTANSKLFGDLQFLAKVQENVVPSDTGSETIKVLTGFVVAKPDQEVSKLRAARIASMIGTNGGYTNKNEAGNISVKGVQGVWEISNASELGISSDDGTVVATSIQSITNSSDSGSENNANLENLLHRKGQIDKKYYTMENTLFLGDNNIEEVGALSAQSASFSDGVEETTITGGVIDAVSATFSGILNVTDVLTADPSNADGNASLNVAAETSLSGKASISGGNQKIEGGVISGAESLTITGGADITGGINTDAINTKELAADDLYAKNNFGAGALASGGYNFNANKDGANLNSGTFTLESGTALKSNNLYTNDSGVAIGARTADGIATAPVQFNTDGDMITTGFIDAPYFASGSNRATTPETANRFEIGLIDDEIVIVSGSGNDRNVEFQADDFYANSADTNFATNNFRVGALDLEPDDNESNYNLVIDSQNDITTSRGQVDFMDTTADDSTTTNKILQVGGTIDSGTSGESNPYVYVRDGAIHVASNNNIDNLSTTAYGTDSEGNAVSKSGYINVDRMVTNHTYTEPLPDRVAGDITNNGVIIAAGYGDKRYDRYQVNPAYTSVMHDIKLATRGGARLSDILPDYIPKGIYVMDNTYQDKPNGTLFDWKSLNEEILNLGETRSGIDGLNENICPKNDSECETSAWLGFLPSPQCPPGYSRIAIMSPLRFKMAEAYAIVEDADGNRTTELSPIINPLTTTASLDYQTATWLNMSLQANNRDATSNDFKGWHALMGFLYPLEENLAYFCEIPEFRNSNSDYCNSSSSTDIVAWNLMPTYNQELSAVVTTYCYFERGNFDPNIVDTEYNQLTNYRKDNDKSSGSTGVYEERLNDDYLGYTDVW